MLSILRDLARAARTLSRSPGYALTTVLSLGMALTLTTTAFLVVDTVRHPYSPIPDGERFVSVGLRSRDATLRVSPYELAAQLDGRSPTLRGATVIAWQTAVLRVGARGQEGDVALVDSAFFRVTGLRPVLGQPFASGARTTEDAGVVVSEPLWRRLFADRERSRGLDGAALTVGDRTYPVVGVMPRGVAILRNVDAWLYRPDGDTRRPSVARTFARVRDGASAERVRTDVSAAATAIVGADRAAAFEPFMFPAVRGGQRLQRLHVTLSGAAFVVLLIACANLANLTLARGLSRRRELALRLSLGATRLRLVWDLLTENVLIGIAGALLGLLGATWGADVLRALMPAEVPLLGELAPHPSWRVLTGCMAATLVVIAGTGVLPALRVTDASAGTAIKDVAGAATGRGRARYAGLVVAEVALSLVLLMAAGLLVRAARNVGLFDFGYDARHVVVSDVRLPKADRLDSLRSEQAYASLVERAARVPGATHAATMQWLDEIGVRGDAERTTWTRTVARVSPDFLATLGIRVTRGRDFLAADASGDGAVILDERAARALWPHGDAVGQMVALGRSVNAPWLRVVGVIPDVHLGFQSDPDLEPEPQVFVTGGVPVPGPRRLLVRAGIAPTGALLATLGLALQAGVPGGTVGPLRPWFDGFEKRRAMQAFLSGLFVLFGAAALVLAAVGQYGVLAFAVGRRTREFGVRLALGASPATVFRHVLRDGAALLLAGTAVGALFAMWAARLLDVWLYRLPPTDVWALVCAEGALALTSIVACSVPAWRATRADPVDVLREA